jgi:RNA polymerase sigma factor for flagellar operon FliA
METRMQPQPGRGGRRTRRLSSPDRLLAKTIREIEGAYARLELALGRPARDSEVCRHLKIATPLFRKAIRQAQGLSLLGAAPFENGWGKAIPAGVGEFALPAVYEIVARGIDRLPIRERLIMSLCAYEGFSPGVVGAILKLTPARVSQLRAKAILRLRGRLAKILKA